MREAKKKPGEFQKKKKRYKHIQNNRDQLKLLREEKIDQAELTVLDPNGLKKVFIERYDYNSYLHGINVVYLVQNGKGHKLHTGMVIDKDAGGGCKIVGVGIIPWKNCLGVIVKEEFLFKHRRGPVGKDFFR